MSRSAWLSKVFGAAVLAVVATTLIPATPAGAITVVDLTGTVWDAANNQIVIRWTITGAPPGTSVIVRSDSGMLDPVVSEADCDATPAISCSTTSVPATPLQGGPPTWYPGMYRYVVDAVDPAGNHTSAWTDVEVDDLPAVTLDDTPAGTASDTLPVARRDMLNPATFDSPYWIKWNPAGLTGTVTVRRVKAGAFQGDPDLDGPIAEDVPAGTGQVKLEAPSAYALTDPHRLTVGRNAFTLVHCRAAAGRKHCSRPTEHAVIVGPDQFDGGVRQYRPVAGGAPVTWSPAGAANPGAIYAVRDVFHPDGGGAAVTTTTWWTTRSYEVRPPGAGVHDLILFSCVPRSGSYECANRAEVRPKAAGVITFQQAGVPFVAAGAHVDAGTQVAKVTRIVNSAPVEEILTVSRAGKFYPAVAEGASVAIDQLVGYANTGYENDLEYFPGLNDNDPNVIDRSFAQVVVGNANPSVTEVDWSSRYSATAWDVSGRGTTGDPLDIVIDEAGQAGDIGDIWEAGELGSGIAHVDDGTLTHHEAPLLRKPGTGKVKPFRNPFNGGKTSLSTYSEKVLVAGNAIWFTQGGDGHTRSQTDDRSRLVRFATDGEDLPSTPYDDRFCAVHVPGDNTSVIGLAWHPTRKQIWFAAEETAGGDEDSYLGWFDDDGTKDAVHGWGFPACDTDLDYDTPATVTAATDANRCDPGDWVFCIKVIPLQKDTAGKWFGLPAHLEIEVLPNAYGPGVDGGRVWLTDWAGGWLRSYTIPGPGFPTGPQPERQHCYRMPAQTLPGGVSGGYSWQLRVFQGKVYVGEYHDNDLVRFTPPAAGAETAANRCTDSTDATPEPGMSEIHLPIPSIDAQLHSIDITSNGRLYFTLGNENKGPFSWNASTFGYLDLATWDTTKSVTLFDNIETAGDQRWRQSFRGIDVAENGVVVLADMHREQIARFTPM